MPKASAKTKRTKPNTTLRFSSEEMAVTNGSNGNHIERPYRINPETPEQREKRLSEREALTLKVFKRAFENNNPKAE